MLFPVVDHRFLQVEVALDPAAGFVGDLAIAQELVEMRALDAAITVGRTTGNGVEISGGGHSVLLFSQ